MPSCHHHHQNNIDTFTEVYYPSLHLSFLSLALVPNVVGCTTPTFATSDSSLP